MIFLMPSISFVTTTQFPSYIPSIHFASAIPKAMRGLEHYIWLYVGAGIGSWCGWDSCRMSLPELKTSIHRSRTHSLSASQLGIISYLSTLVMSKGLGQFCSKFSLKFFINIKTLLYPFILIIWA